MIAAATEHTGRGQRYELFNGIAKRSYGSVVERGQVDRPVDLWQKRTRSCTGSDVA